MVGTVVWRGLRIPLVSFERILGAGGGSPRSTSRAVVFNTLNGNRALPFIALLSQRIPRLLLVTGSVLNAIDGAVPGDGVLMRVEMHGDELVVPDMDRMEQLLVQHGIRVERVVD
jgi:chemosensory pili system protein ChpC